MDDRLCVLKHVEEYICIHRWRHCLWSCIVVEVVTIDAITYIRKEKDLKIDERYVARL